MGGLGVGWGSGGLGDQTASYVEDEVRMDAGIGCVAYYIMYSPPRVFTRIDYHI